MKNIITYKTFKFDKSDRLFSDSLRTLDQADSEYLGLDLGLKILNP